MGFPFTPSPSKLGPCGGEDFWMLGGGQGDGVWPASVTPRWMSCVRVGTSRGLDWIQRFNARSSRLGSGGIRGFGNALLLRLLEAGLTLNLASFSVPGVRSCVQFMAPHALINA